MPFGRGYSSVGRATRSQCVGQGFDSPYLHQIFEMVGIMIDIIIFFLILFIPIAAFITMYMMYNNSSDSRIYQKNLFDWIVYVLAWLAVPFFSVSCFVLDPMQPPTYRYTLMKGKNWEERRRKNLYLFILFCTSIGMILGTFFYFKNSINFLEKHHPLAFFIFIPLFIALFCCASCGIWKLMQKYEKHIEGKSYIPKITLNVKKGIK